MIVEHASTHVPNSDKKASQLVCLQLFATPIIFITLAPVVNVINNLRLYFTVVSCRGNHLCSVFKTSQVILLQQSVTLVNRLQHWPQSGVEASLPGSPINVESSPSQSATTSSTATTRTSKASPVKRLDDDNEKFTFFRNMTDSREKKEKLSPTKVRKS
jgi:hypothetical protein